MFYAYATEKVLCAGATSIMLQVTERAEALNDKLRFL